jgi:hypothetical protein
MASTSTVVNLPTLLAKWTTLTKRFRSNPLEWLAWIALCAGITAYMVRWAVWLRKWILWKRHRQSLPTIPSSDPSLKSIEHLPTIPFDPIHPKSPTFKSNQSEKKFIVTISVRNCVVWSPSSDPAVPNYAFLEGAKQALTQLALHPNIELHLLAACATEQERRALHSLLQGKGTLHLVDYLGEAPPVGTLLPANALAVLRAVHQLKSDFHIDGSRSHRVITATAKLLKCPVIWIRKTMNFPPSSTHLPTPEHSPRVIPVLPTAELNHSLSRCLTQDSLLGHDELDVTGSCPSSKASWSSSGSATEWESLEPEVAMTPSFSSFVSDPRSPLVSLLGQALITP